MYNIKFANAQQANETHIHAKSASCWSVYVIDYGARYLQYQMLQTFFGQADCRE
jgi:hypothetical protein